MRKKKIVLPTLPERPMRSVEDEIEMFRLALEGAARARKRFREAERVKQYERVSAAIL